VPRNHGPNVTVLAAVGAHGITAAMTTAGANDGAVWALFARQILAPSWRPGQAVAWDNLAVHKTLAVRQLIEEHGRQARFLPPYSPDFSPIEQAFGTLKTRVRRANARTRPALEEAIAAGLATITARDARAWFRHGGHALPEQLL
jgi:transposase